MHKAIWQTAPATWSAVQEVVGVRVTGNAPQNAKLCDQRNSAQLEGSRVNFNTDTNSTRLSAPDLTEQATAISALVRCD
jgi:hypothetical protein